MSDWIQHPLHLDGEKVQLQPLEAHHFEALLHLGEDPVIWQFMPIDGSATNLRNAMESSLAARGRGEQYPFVVIDKVTGRVIGSTSLLKLNPPGRSLEIGWTWYHPDYWGKGYNEECKLLLLTYCFERLGTVRVEFITWDQNQRSRKAIARIGGQFEGVRRNAAIRHNGKRHAAIFSIIDDEWGPTKTMLTGLRNKRYQ